jgi:hypothetical protein
MAHSSRRPLLSVLLAFLASFPLLFVSAVHAAELRSPLHEDSPSADTLEPPPAQTIHKGAVARSQVVGLGRDVLVEGKALSDVAAVNGSVIVSGTVEGDVLVLGGDARLASTARVAGRVFVLGGSLEAEAGASIGQPAVAYPSVSSAWLALVEAPALGLGAGAPIVLVAKVALLVAWLILMLLLFAVAGRPLLSTAEGVAQEPIRNFWMGLTGVLTLVMTGLFLGAFAGPVIGFPFVVLIVLLLLLAKLWGMVAVFYVVGRWCFNRLRRRSSVLTVATVGLLVLGVIKFLPWLGLWVWTVATLVGVGAAFTTKFGRREDWFELTLLDVLSRTHS